MNTDTVISKSFCVKSSGVVPVLHRVAETLDDLEYNDIFKIKRHNKKYFVEVMKRVEPFSEYFIDVNKHPENFDKHKNYELECGMHIVDGLSTQYGYTGSVLNRYEGMTAYKVSLLPRWTPLSKVPVGYYDEYGSYNDLGWVIVSL